MLTYIIDGFNLFHKISRLEGSLSPHRDLVDFIKHNKLTGSRNNRVVIAFDGHENHDVCHEREFNIFFSGDGTADDLIKKKVVSSKNKSQIVVVSDDHEIRDCARAEGAQTWGTAEFLSNKRNQKRANVDKSISCSEAIEINEELSKIWLTDK